MLNFQTTALLIVDVQKDFLERGALAVPHANQILPEIHRLSALPFAHIIATKDWHPAQHLSFAANHLEKKVGDEVLLEGKKQILWPRHCVQYEEGSDFPDDFPKEKVKHIVYKGEDPKRDSYSAFFDNHGENELALRGLLQSLEVDTLVIAGLATDWCVLATVLDARRLGFKVIVDKAGCRAVNLHPGDEEKAIKKMKASGVRIVQSVKELVSLN